MTRDEEHLTKTWLMTGASRGFGRAFAEAALQRGDRVAATARKVEDLTPLIEQHGGAVSALELDVTEPEAVERVVAQAAEVLGRLDVVVNNAGHGLLGAVEELPAARLREAFEVNFFGAVAMTQAVLPVLRQQGGGHIVQISSMAGITTAPLLGGYSATKWALEAISEALAAEVQGFGIHVTLVEPGAFGTEFGGNAVRAGGDLDAYAPIYQSMASRAGQQSFGAPAAAAAALLTLVDDPNPPLRAIFGDGGTDRAITAAQGRIQEWTTGQDLARAAQN